MAFAAGQATPLEGDDGTFVRSAKTTDGVVARQDRVGGHFVSGASPSDGRPRNRFSIGTAQRTQFDLFSSAEEAALWALRESQLTPPKPASGSHARRKKLRSSNLVWPKVVLRGQLTCVPVKEFAEAPDWKDHLTCWNPEKKNVE